jgi:hypothetical protein
VRNSRDEIGLDCGKWLLGPDEQAQDKRQDNHTTYEILCVAVKREDLAFSPKVLQGHDKRCGEQKDLWNVNPGISVQMRRESLLGS